jgi:signal transduction histidine kinase
MALTDNLSARISIILLAGSAVLLIMIGLLAGLPTDGGGAPRVFQIPMPREALAIVQAVEAGPPAARPAIVRGLDAAVMQVRLAPGFPPPGDDLRAATAADLGYRGYATAFGGRIFRIDVRMRGRLRPFAPGRDAVRLSVGLKGGGVLIMQRRPSRTVRNLLARAALIVAGAALVVLAMLAAAVRQTTRPVAALALAVDRFGDRLDAADLPLSGPREIRALAQAFNAMQQRIRGLVDDRTRMLAAVAHDMRTYLTRLRLRAEFIGDDAQRAKAVADLDEMGALLGDTLLFAGMDAGGHGKDERIDLGQELAELVELRREMGDLVTLEAVEGVEVHGSRLALRRMVGNLVDNALRFAGEAEVLLLAGGREARISVRDRGPGLPEEALERVTGPFERMEGSRNRATGGAGLGLAIVRALAEAQGGRLSLGNRPGGGLVAEVSLPRILNGDASGR